MKFFAVKILLIGGIMAIYFLWPKSISLPKMGTVTDWELTEVGTRAVPAYDKPKLITFFYTNCPDICPTTMIDLQNLQQSMANEGITEDQYMIVSITLDPAYDTEERILQYKEAFGISSPNWVFLRGSEDEIIRFTESFNFVFEKNKNGFLTHSTSMYIVDSENQIRSNHDMAVGDKKVNNEEIISHFRQLIQEAE
ncbi:SCO family protein [Paenisporosarcina quisquiliarum]|uniref:SCO family protein n=1 Tax=Paenisporosarcina quisquiliarum TaxID=365346 RepID=A0A9X3LEB5_9BACL|nr:SCO family protein [Paenisporosarcina quisquiliarum]MCZ8536308.1 SCO family protein [Paenisporosarcina quisquiliarum]